MRSSRAGQLSERGYPVPSQSGNPITVPSTGVAAIDTAAIQAAHDALPSTGGAIHLDAGPYLLTAGTVSFTKPTHLIGAAGANGSNVAFGSMFAGTGSLIQCASSTGVAIAVNADGCNFEKLHFKNTSGTTPTAGAAVQVQSNGKMCRYIDCTFEGFYNQLDVAHGYYWKVDRCHFFDPVNSCVQIQELTNSDAGDQTISNSDFTAGPNNATPVAAINWFSGGGLKVLGCKINQVTSSQAFTVGVNLQIADGASTGGGFISCCSIENVQYGVLVQHKGPSNTGVINRVAVTGCEFLATGYGVAFSASLVGKISDLAAVGNVGSATTALVLVGAVDNVQVAGNRPKSGTAELSVIANVSNLKIDGIKFTTAARPSAAAMAPGSWYFDTTLNKPGFADGAGNWRDASGTTI